MQEKPINQVVKEFTDEFGTVEFKAVDEVKDLTVASKNWIEHSCRLEISGADYLALGNLQKYGSPSDGVIAGLMKLALGKR